MSPHSTGETVAAVPFSDAPRRAGDRDVPADNGDESTAPRERVRLSGARPAAEDEGRRTRNPVTPVRETGTEPVPKAPKPPKSKAKKPPRRKRRARKVHRVVKHIELWSVFKVAVIFFACMYVIALTAGYMLWRAADQAGTIGGIEGFFEESGGYDPGSFIIDGDIVFRTAALGGIVIAAGFVAFSVIGALLFNLISDLTGGVRMTVIDEDLIVAGPRKRKGATGPATVQTPAQRRPADAPSGPPRARPEPAPRP